MAPTTELRMENKLLSAPRIQKMPETYQIQVQPFQNPRPPTTKIAAKKSSTTPTNARAVPAPRRGSAAAATRGR